MGKSVRTIWIEALREWYDKKQTMRRDPDYFHDQEMVLVYVARRLKEAKALEGLLDVGGLDYAVEPAPFGSGTLFRSQRIGAFFYVLPQSEDRARALMFQSGYIPHAET